MIRVSISLAGRPGLLASFRFFPGIANTTLKALLIRLGSQRGKEKTTDNSSAFPSTEENQGQREGGYGSSRSVACVEEPAREARVAANKKLPLVKPGP